jgi:hypothetical protein
MTINRLFKILTLLKNAGHGRRLVCVDKSKCTHPLESDGCCIMPVTDAALNTHEMLDADGGTDFKADGTVRTRKALVITAES